LKPIYLVVQLEDGDGNVIVRASLPVCHVDWNALRELFDEKEE